MRPVYQANTKKWSGFVSHIRNEAETMKAIRESVLNDAKSTGAYYTSLRQRSTRVIFRPPKTTSMSTNQEPSNLPKLHSRSQTKQETRSVMTVLEPNTTNNYNFPKRKSAAGRIFNPDKLKIYDVKERQKDVAVLSGALFSDDVLITI